MGRRIAGKRWGFAGERLHSRLLQEHPDFRAIDSRVEVTADQAGARSMSDRLSQSPQLRRSPILMEPEMDAPDRGITQRDSDGTARLTTAAGQGQASGRRRGFARQQRVPERRGAKAQPSIETRVHTQLSRQCPRLIHEARPGKMAIYLLKEQDVTGAVRERCRDASKGGGSRRISPRMDIVRADAHMFHVKRGLP
jgi:hypothetical protein